MGLLVVSNLRNWVVVLNQSGIIMGFADFDTRDLAKFHMFALCIFSNGRILPRK